jgi:hypothetical protein
MVGCPVAAAALPKFRHCAKRESKSTQRGETGASRGETAQTPKAPRQSDAAALEERNFLRFMAFREISLSID